MALAFAAVMRSDSKQYDTYALFVCTATTDKYHTLLWLVIQVNRLDEKYFSK